MLRIGVRQRELFAQRDSVTAAILRSQRTLRMLDARAELIRDKRVREVEVKVDEHIEKKDHAS